jgi:hypothetical protein
MRIEKLLKTSEDFDFHVDFHGIGYRRGSMSAEIQHICPIEI